MSYLQLHIEIKNLKEALDASQKKVDRYSHLIAALSDELDNLRSSICHTCKSKLVPGSGLVPAPAVQVAAPSAAIGLSVVEPSASRGQPPSRLPINNATATSSFNLRASLSPVREVALKLRNKPLPVLPVIPRLSASETTTVGVSPEANICSDERSTISLEQKPELPVWSVVYNPEVTKALNPHVVHVFTYKTPVYCVKMSPDGQRVAIGLENNGKTYINEVKTGSNIHVLVDLYFVKTHLTIYSVKFSPDGRFLATAASDMRIRIWDIAQRRMRAMFKGHKGVLETLDFSPDGRSLVSGSGDRSIRIWKIRDGSSTKLTLNAGHFTCVAFSPDGMYIAAGNLDQPLKIWDLRTHKLVARWAQHGRDVWCVQFTPDGKGLMSGSRDKVLRYWDLSSLGVNQKQSVRQRMTLEQGFPEIRSFEGHTKLVRSIAFFPRNSRWVLSSAEDQSVRVWDTQTGVWQMTLLGHSDWVRAVDCSRTEHFLVTGSRDRRVAIWKYDVL